jgi:hypothetical protein
MSAALPLSRASSIISVTSLRTGSAARKMLNVGLDGVSRRPKRARQQTRMACLVICPPTARAMSRAHPINVDDMRRPATNDAASNKVSLGRYTTGAKSFQSPRPASIMGSVPLVGVLTTQSNARQRLPTGRTASMAPA